MAIEKVCDSLHKAKATMAMVVVQIAFAGVNIFYKLAAIDGMNLSILVAYRLLFASASIFPLALLFERESMPKLTWEVIWQAFLCGLLGGSLAQNLYVQGLALTSATFASAMTNLVPAMTFAIAVCFGLEKLAFKTLSGKAKVGGTLLGIAGAMLLTFYKGSEINIWSTHVDLVHSAGHVASSHGQSGNFGLGALLVLGCCFSYALWLSVQAKMSDTFPFHYSSTALMCLMGSIQAVVFALCMERDWKQWKLGWNIRLVTVVYTGTVASGLMVSLVAWCVHMKGPLFVSIFNPLMLILVAIAGSFLLNEKLHLGSILGATLILCGLYMVLWGKNKEMKRIAQLMPSKSSRESNQIQIVVTSSAANNNDMVITPSNNFVAATGTNVHGSSDTGLSETDHDYRQEIAPMVN